MQIKKLIVLCGSQGTGKTTVMNMVAKKCTNIVSLKKGDYSGSGDFVIKCEYNKLLLGLVSQGDDYSKIVQGNNYLVQSEINFDIVICTCHPSKIVKIIDLYGFIKAITVIKNDFGEIDNRKCFDELIKEMENV